MWRVSLRLFLAALAVFPSLPAAFAQCPVPTAIHSSQLTPSSVQLNWSAASADSFLVRYRESASVVYRYKRIPSGSATGTFVDSLSPNTTYIWQVRSFCSGTSSAYQQSAAAFTTPAEDVYCSVPNGTVSSAVTSSGATLSWNDHIIADSFEVRYAPSGSLNFNTAILPGNTHGLSLTALLPSTTYQWSVRSCCVGVLLPFSPWNFFSTFSDSCSKPSSSSLSASNITLNSATVSWSAVAGAVSYTVRYQPSGSSRWNTVSSPTNQALLSRLRPGTLYDFSVQTVCSSGTSVWTSSADFRTTTVSPIITRGPYLQQTSGTSTFIRWRTDIPTDSKVLFGTAANNLNRTATDTNTTTEHIVAVTGLLPSTTYYYAIGTSTQRLAGDTGYYVRTNPPVGSTGRTRIWATGDFGMASTGQAQVRDAYMNYCATTRVPTDLWIWLGDNAYYSGLDEEYQLEVFDMYPYQFRKFNCWPATGNHDLVSCDAAAETGPYFENFTLPRNGEVGGIPSHTEAYYSFNYANIHFICLESTDADFRAVGGDMLTWLEQDLQANRQRWTIVYFHHPPYSKGSHDSDNSTELEEMRTNVVPILENHKVDLVLSGHSHAYERSYLLRGHLGTESTFDMATMAVDSGPGTYPVCYTKSSPGFLGTVYVVCGVSGRLSSTSSGWPHNAMYTSTNTWYGSMVIDVTGDRLDCRFLTGNGALRDEFTILKSGSQFVPYPDAGDLSRTTTSASPISALTIFPNPVLNDASVEVALDKASSVRLEVYDAFGRRVTETENQDLPSGLHRLPIRSAVLPSGYYILQVIASGYPVARRFVKP
ncbi:MAG: hypothetical protein RL213_1049 [Bacteroidota bacterium]